MRICICAYLYTYQCIHTEHQDTGQRRSIGCLRLQVMFRKRATNYRALLRKTTYKDKASYDFTPHCNNQDPQRMCIYIYMPMCIHKYTYIQKALKTAMRPLRYVQICINPYSYTCTYLYTYTCIHTEHTQGNNPGDPRNMRICICTYTDMHIFLFIYMYTHTYIHTGTHKCIHAHPTLNIYLFVQLYIHTYLQTQAHTYMRTHICGHTHMYTRSSHAKQVVEFNPLK